MTQMFSAANAYLKAVKNIVAPEKEVGASASKNFGNLIQTSVADVANQMKAAEVQSIKSVDGGKDLMNVIHAVNSAEVALQTVVAVRDKVVNAYQEMMRMPI